MESVMSTFLLSHNYLRPAVVSGANYNLQSLRYKNGAEHSMEHIHTEVSSVLVGIATVRADGQIRSLSSSHRV